MKGRAIAIRWGVSIGYVPHSVAAAPAWHRTGKQARFDLWEDSVEAYGRRLCLPDGTISTTLGLRGIADDGREVWAQVEHRALGLWERARTPTGVLAVADEQAREAGLQEPRPWFVAAFALARMGDLAAATARVDGNVDHLPGDPVAVAAALRTVAARAERPDPGNCS
jgi:hypothetical protein